MPRPVYWRQRYAGRSARHRAWVRQEERREAAVRAEAAREREARGTLLARLRRRLGWLR